MNALATGSAAAPVWVPARRFSALVLLVAGVASLVVVLAALPPVLVAVSAAAWSVAVVVAAQASVGPAALTVLSIIIKTGTVVIVALLLVDPASPFAPHSPLDWIPLGTLNMGSGLWFLRVIRGRAA